MIETAADFVEKNTAKLRNFTTSERKLSANQPEIDPTSGNRINFQNIDHILDKKLILLVNDPNVAGSSWELPKIEWKEDAASLREVCQSILYSFFHIFYEF